MQTRRDLRVCVAVRAFSVATATVCTSLLGHAMAGGQLPSEAERTFVLLGCVAIGVQASTMPSLSRVGPLLGFLAAGQIVMHLAMALPNHDHHSVRSSAMVAVHTAAAIVAAVAIAGAESALAWLARSMGHVRHALALALPVTECGRPWVLIVWMRDWAPGAGALDSISRRGPPARDRCLQLFPA